MQYEELDSRHSKLVTEVHDMKEISQSKDFEIQELKEKLRLKQIELDEVIQIRDGQRKGKGFVSDPSLTMLRHGQNERENFISGKTTACQTTPLKE